MTRGSWVGPDGWPCDHPPGLIEAIAALPGAGSLGPDAIEHFARLIEVVDDGGRDAESPSARPATAAASDAELAKLQTLCIELVDHIEAMHEPARSALCREAGRGGSRLPLLIELLRETTDHAHCAYGGTGAPDRLAGRPAKVAAAEVTKIAAHVYKEITGRRATFTTDPATSTVSGVWPDFLGNVFAALYIDASVASQVKALKSEK